jgi:hypothetical protein
MFSLFKNNQKWLTNSIPSKKVDNNDLVRDVLFKIVVHFVEDEHGLDDLSWIEDATHREILEDIQNIYNWITEERQLLVDKIEQIENNFSIPENEDIIKYINTKFIDEIVQFHTDLTDRDTKMLLRIIELRDFLVTI